MATKKTAKVPEFKLVPDAPRSTVKKLTAAQTKLLKEALAEVAPKMEALRVAQDNHYRNNTETAVYDAYEAYGSVMATVSSLAASFGVTVEVKDADGYDQEVGANGFGQNAYDWVPSSIC